MSRSQHEPALKFVHGKSNTDEARDISASVNILSRSFEGRQLLEAAAQLEIGDLRSLAQFATAAARGAW